MKRLPRVLIIDDVYGKKGNERVNFCLRNGLKDPDSQVEIEKPVAEAFFCRGQVEQSGIVTNDLAGTMGMIRQGWLDPPRCSLVLLDLHFDTGKPEDRDPRNYFGLKILSEIYHTPELRDIPVIILSAMDREAIEKQFADHGVFDFIDKNEINRERMSQLLFSHGLLEEETLLGTSVPFLKSLREARRRASTGNENILIMGETGTGKELIAKYIHRQSGRTGNFRTLFTQGAPETLIETRLFGYDKGAYTGALKEGAAGEGELADGGTLFIDEFSNIPSTIQDKLLRLLDKNTREVQRLGSKEYKKLDLLTVMATNDMEILANKNVKGDLLFRIKADTPIILPPLRERQEDIPLLARFFVKKYEKIHAANERTLTDEAMDKLISYPWPGNIRELEGVLENAVYNYKGLKVLSANHLALKDRIKSTLFKPVPPGLQEEKKVNDKDLSIPNLEALLEGLAGFDFKNLKQEELKGKLPQIEDTFARVMVRYLNATLKSTLSYSSQNPDGEISYHRALKLMSGDFAMKATPARRLLNSLLKISPGVLLDLCKEEPLIKEVIERFGDDRLKAELKQYSSQEKE